MPNWCSSSYVIEGDKKEVKKLYGIMHGLEKRKTPAVENGFGTAWLGCLVNALGADWNKVYCRGDWSNLEMEQDMHIPADTRSAFPVISVQSPVSIQCCWQS